jgi:predicted ATP-grasp superfamily ATP-dependent carboligase
MELVERRDGRSVFGMHAAACAEGRLPENGRRAEPLVGKAIGKAIVFARHAVAAGDTRGWLELADVADVPAPGAILDAGAPVCTVFATGATAAACYEALVSRAQEIYTEMRAWPALWADGRAELVP